MYILYGGIKNSMNTIYSASFSVKNVFTLFICFVQYLKDIKSLNKNQLYKFIIKFLPQKSLDQYEENIPHRSIHH